MAAGSNILLQYEVMETIIDSLTLTWLFDINTSRKNSPICMKHTDFHQKIQSLFYGWIYDSNESFKHPDFDVSVLNANQFRREINIKFVLLVKKCVPWKFFL